MTLLMNWIFLFTSSGLDNDDLANLSLDEPDMELVTDISDTQELKSAPLHRVAAAASTSVVGPVASCSQRAIIERYGISAGS